MQNFESDLNPKCLPRHVGIVMDGNGRWASRRKLPRIAGHRKGVDRVREITESAGNLGISALTLYAFSDENWRRPENEVGALMGLLRWYLRAEREQIIKKNVRFRIIGDRQKLSLDILKMVDQLEYDTLKNTGMWLSVAISYGGRGEILRGIKKIVADVQAGELFAEDVTEDLFEQKLDTVGLPPLDMVIRTSGEMRMSNFLLWQAAYAELFFDVTLWPDFTVEHFISHLQQFASRERRFGASPEQIKAEKSQVSALASI